MADIIAITTAANQTNINLVLEAMGRGPGSLAQPSSADPGVAWNGTPTHFYMSDQGAPQWLADAFLAFGDNNLPPLPEGVVWGEDGVISAADALEAIQPENFYFAQFVGFEPSEQLAAALAAKGLHKFPPNPNE
jgi:hypothetical protein